MVDQTSLGLRSLVKQDGALELSLAQVTVSPPKDDEVIVRVEATPINPSDLGLLLAAGDISSAKVSGKGSADGGHGVDCACGDARALRPDRASRCRSVSKARAW